MSEIASAFDRTTLAAPPLAPWREPDRFLKAGVTQAKGPQDTGYCLNSRELESLTAPSSCAIGNVQGLLPKSFDVVQGLTRNPEFPKPLDSGVCVKCPVGAAFSRDNRGKMSLPQESIFILCCDLHGHGGL